MLSGWRCLGASARRFCRLLDLCGQLRRAPIDANSVALLDNRFGNSVREEFAIFPVTRFVSFVAIAQVPAFYKHGGTSSIAQDTEICGVNSTIRGVGDSHQLFLDQVRQIN